jgi:hypothetical protein
MIKRILAFFAVAVVALSMVSPAYAASLSTAEQAVLDKFDDELAYWVKNTDFDKEHKQQYYTEARTFNIAGRKSSEIVYDPERIADVEFDLSIVESNATPAYRLANNELLKEIWASGQITLEQFLEAGNFEFADDLLQSIRSQQEQMAKGEMAGGIDPQLMARAQAGADMQAVARAEQMLRG